LLYKFDYW